MTTTNTKPKVTKPNMSDIDNILRVVDCYGLAYLDSDGEAALISGIRRLAAERDALAEALRRLADVACDNYVSPHSDALAAARAALSDLEGK